MKTEGKKKLLEGEEGRWEEKEHRKMKRNKVEKKEMAILEIATTPHFWVLI